MELEKIAAVIIELLEEQEYAEISYAIKGKPPEERAKEEENEEAVKMQP